MPTVVFGVSIKHSKYIANIFKQNGVPSGHIDGEMPEIEREEQLEKLNSGKIKVLSNKREFIVDKLGTFNPDMTNLSTLSSGMVGFMIASIKTLDSAPVGDTIVLSKDE